MLAIHHDPGKARIRPSLLATLVLLGGLVAAAALQLFTLGGTVVRSFQPVFVDAPALEEQIAEWAAARDDQPFHVTCPVEGIAFDRHDVFTCEATSTFGSASRRVSWKKRSGASAFIRQTPGFGSEAAE